MSLFSCISFGSHHHFWMQFQICVSLPFPPPEERTVSRIIKWLKNGKESKEVLGIIIITLGTQCGPCISCPWRYLSF